MEPAIMIKTSYYIRLNGKYPDLAFIETKSLIEIFDPASEMDRINDVMLQVKVRENKKHDFLKFFMGRTGLGVRITESVGEFNSYEKMEEYKQIFQKLPSWEKIKAKSFRVSALYSFRQEKKIPTNKIERVVGAIIAKNWTNAKVNLEEPEVEILIEICFGKIFVGINDFRVFFRKKEKRAFDRAIFRPGTMRTSFAKVIVNLSGAKRGELVIDPFCGVGGLMIEAEKMGIHSVGIDIDRLIARGAAKNLEESGSGFSEIIRSTALEIPILKMKNYVIATDPPYDRAVIPVGENGRTSSKRLFEQFLEEVQTWEIRPRRIGVAPSEMYARIS